MHTFRQPFALADPFARWSCKCHLRGFAAQCHSRLVLNMLFTNRGVSLNCGTPKSSILIGISIKNHPFWGIPIFGNTHIFTTCRCWLCFLSLFIRLFGNHDSLPSSRTSHQFHVLEGRLCHSCNEICGNSRSNLPIEVVASVAMINQGDGQRSTRSTTRRAAQRPNLARRSRKHIWYNINITYCLYIMHVHNLQLPECTIYIYIIIVIHKHTYRQSTIKKYNVQSTV